MQARFLLTSTSEVYGDPLVHPQPETYFGNVNPIGERSCYDEGKRVAETLTFDYQREHGVEVWDLVEIRFQTYLSVREEAKPTTSASQRCCPSTTGASMVWRWGLGQETSRRQVLCSILSGERAKPNLAAGVKGRQMARATNQRDCSRPRRRACQVTQLTRGFHRVAHGLHSAPRWSIEDKLSNVPVF